MTTIRIIGPGRAGRSLAMALASVGAFTVDQPWGRDREIETAAAGVDAVVIATPDSAIADVARAMRPNPGAVVLHLSGSLGLDVLQPHGRRASLHPLVPLPTPSIGSERLRSGATFAVAGDPMAGRIATALSGRVVEVDDVTRVSYHAAASIAANHVVALLGQVERVAATAHLPLDAFAGLIRHAVEDALALGPGAALTGPASRGDWETVSRHRCALAGMDGGESEVAAYDALVGLAGRLTANPGGAVLLDLLGTPDEPWSRTDHDRAAAGAAPAAPATQS